MKKIIFTTVFSLLFCGLISAQSFETGNSVVNIGIGYPSAIHGGNYYDWKPSITASYEYGIVEIPMGSKLHGVISAGAYLGYSGSKYSVNSSSTDYHKISIFMFTARGNYHFIFHDQLDTYAGLELGGYNVSSKPEGDPIPFYDDGVHFWAGAYIGARWFFTPGFAVYLELGRNMSIFEGGVAFKF